MIKLPLANTAPQRHRRSLRERTNAALDRLARPQITLGRWQVAAFHLCGALGLALAIALSQLLVVARSLSPWIMALISLVAVLTLFALALLALLLRGDEQLVFYQHAIAVLLVTTLLLWLLGQPVLAYLDITLLGIGLFQACGRVGCLMAGCCHGRPSRWGVRYRLAHAQAGFTRLYVGVRLFPIQALEALGVAAIVAFGSLLVLRGSPAGTALTWYVVLYDLGRFCLEFGRADLGRPYIAGFSEGQWTALLLLAVLVGAEWLGLLPLHLWHAAALAALILAMLALSAQRRLRPLATARLLHPQHLYEIAQIVAQLSGGERQREEPASEVLIGATSLGILISSSTIAGSGSIAHYTLSWQRGIMPAEAARVVATLIRRLRDPVGRDELINANQRVFHLLIHSEAQADG